MITISTLKTELKNSEMNFNNYSFEIVIWDSEDKISKEQLIQNIKGKFGIVCSPNSATIDEDVIESAGEQDFSIPIIEIFEPIWWIILFKTLGDSLKVVSTFSVGLDHLDIEKLKSKKIRIGNAPEVLVPTVAEFAIALLLATSRRIVEGHLATLRLAINLQFVW